jgi:autotransporter-associated beta strand protein
MLRSKKLVPAFVLALAVSPVVKGAVTIDGSLDLVGEGYTRYATQTNNTQFGDATNPDGNSTGGSELNAAYAKVENGKLYLFFAGNTEGNNSYNHLNVFIADGRPGQSTINATGGQGGITNMNGSKFSPGFAATFALDLNAGGAPCTGFVNTYNMTLGTAPSNYIGSYAANDGLTHSLTTGVQISLNNTNIAGVDGSAPSAANAAAAEAVTTGYEVAVPLSLLGSPSGTDLKILADINGGGNSFLSNQFLPGLPVQGNIGNAGKFDFSATPNMWFNVPVPVISNSSTWALTGGGSWNAVGNWTGPIPTNATDTANFGTAITSASTVTLDGNRTAGRVVFNNANKYTIAAGSPAGSLTINDTGNPLGEDPSISVLLGSHEISAPVSMYNGMTLSTVDNTSLTLSGAVGGVGNITKSGAGSVVLSGTNTFVGDLNVEGGTLQISSAAALSSATVFIGANDIDGVPAALSLGAAGLNISAPITTNRDAPGADNLRTIASDVAGSNTISSTINVNGGVVLSAATGGTLTVSGVIQDGLDTHGSARRAIHAAGTGYVVLTNANTATGDTFVDGGTLVLSSGASLAGGSLNVFTNGVAIIDGSLSPTVKIYSQGKTYFPGATTGSVTINTATLAIDAGGLMKVGTSASSANPVIINAGSVEFLGDFSGKFDLTNNQLITTNDQTYVRNEIAFSNLITTANGVLGYKDTGSGTTIVQFAVAGDANLDGKVNTIDFNDLAGNFGTGLYWSQGDFNYNGVIDSTDFDIFVANHGKTLPVSSPGLGSVVPEPASAALLAIGAVSLLGRRRRD